MGAYTEALDFLREIGASAKLRVQPRLRVALAHPELGLGEVAAPPVPGPLQAPLALLRYRLLAPGDRVRLLAGALRLTARDRALAGRTVAQALADVGQSRAACERFWHQPAIATLNEPPETAAASTRTPSSSPRRAPRGCACCRPRRAPRRPSAPAPPSAPRRS